jgi:hypothetical protein
MSIAAEPSSNAQPFSGEIWRMVESQSRVSTLSLTDTIEEQAVLEQLIEEVKPDFPPGCAGLHYLLATPFRYAPYPHGSRFRRAGQREGVFYGSRRIETAAAELAFYRLLFFKESPDTKLPARPVEHTAFSVRVRGSAADLTRPPFEADRTRWENLTNYADCQDLADQARADGIDMLIYRSVRDPRGGDNVALLTPKAFADALYRRQETWRLFVRPHSVQAIREFPPAALEFKTADFAADPRLA